MSGDSSSEGAKKKKSPSIKKKKGTGLLPVVPKPELDPSKLQLKHFMENHVHKFLQVKSILPKYTTLSPNFQEWISEGVVRLMLSDFDTYERHIFEMIPSLAAEMTSLGLEGSVPKMK